MRAVLFLLVAACVDPVEPEPTPMPSIECPAQAEQCAVRDGGWEARRDNGVVTVDDLTATQYCAPGSFEVLCETGGRGDAQVVHTCAATCIDDFVYLETIDEYSRFTPSSMCM